MPYADHPELLAQEAAKANKLYQNAGQAQNHPSTPPSKEVVSGNPEAMRDSLSFRIQSIDEAIEHHEHRLNLLRWERSMCEAALKSFKEHSEAPRLDCR